MPKDVKKPKKMRGGTLQGISQEVLDSFLDETPIKKALLELNIAIDVITTDPNTVTKTNISDILNKLSVVLNLLDEDMTVLESAKATPPSGDGTGADINVGGGSRKKKSSSKKVKRVGGNVDMSKLYNVAGLIVDSKDPVAVAGGIGPDSTPMPFSANGQGLRYTGGISRDFMNDLNPSLGLQGGAKKKGKGKK